MEFFLMLIVLFFIAQIVGLVVRSGWALVEWFFRSLFGVKR